MDISIFITSVARKSPGRAKKWILKSLFMAVRQLAEHLDKVPFLLVRFLWAIKENEQDKTVKAMGLKRAS